MTFRCNAASLAEKLEACERSLQADRIGPRLKARDHTIWSSDPTEIADRLGWLNLPTVMSTKLELIERIVAHASAAGLTHALLVGMGGSSLAPEVFNRVIGTRAGHLLLTVLDSTHPDAVRAAVAATPPLRTLILVSTKSGGTIETVNLFRYLYTWLERKLSRTVAQERVVVITDIGSSLDQEARLLRVAHIVHGDPEVGGRYSALSAFGLVPAALLGIDVRQLLYLAAAEAEQPIETSPGFRIGALIGTAACAGRDKLTLHASPSLAPLGIWIEQLIAESTGKDGRGIVPIDGERELAVNHYLADRLFAFHRYSNELPANTKALIDAGHPVTECVLESAQELGAVMYRWEIATAVAGAVMGINPFDQPDVEAAKVSARHMVDTYHETGALPTLTQTAAGHGLTLYCTSPPASEAGSMNGKKIEDALDQFFREPAGYIALNAYLSPTSATDTALDRLRRLIQDRSGTVTTCGYGPRFLHSTGQLHKGDSGCGSFIQLTADINFDLPIPDRAGTNKSSLSFGVLLQAQSLGDRQALLDAGRRVISVGLGADPIAGLNALAAAVD